MNISNAYGPERFGLSFELFPPKTPKGDQSLFEHVSALMDFSPSYITCTYGAGGSTREKTLDIVETVKEKFHVPVASHLTCVGSSVEQLRNYLQEAQDRGIDNIVALRGDPPQGEAAFQPTEDGLSYANELVELICEGFPQFGIAVAGYPEKHREAPSEEIDLENLNRKVTAGADVVLTQLFYQNEDFFNFRARYIEKDIRVPLVPGILPVTSLSQIKRISSLCGAVLPKDFVSQLEKHEDADWQFKVGVEFAVEQVQSLIDGGVPGLHFYVLNKSQATSEILHSVTLP